VLEPLPEIPPPPELAGDPDLEPQITIKRKEGETVEEATGQRSSDLDQGDASPRQVRIT
jgi:hypothetical protein